VRSRDDAPEAVTLYRQVLSSQPDGSATIVAIGWLTNLAELLQSSPDHHSPLTGTELVAAKVRELVTMGGVWPNTIGQADYNFRMDREAAKLVIDTWPTPVMFTGLGLDVMTGGRLVSTVSAANPVSVFYQNFFRGFNVSERPSWDLIAVLYAVRGLSNYFTAVSRGKCVYPEDGDTQWMPGPNRNHSYLCYEMAQSDLSEVLEDLLVTPPRRK
jgi:inosine-uridine nucleoside N-ribohydrolase